MRVLSIDIGVGRVNLLISVLENGKILAVDSTKLEIADLSELTPRIKEYMYQHSFTGKVVVSLSEDMVVSRFFKLPVVSEKKIRQMIPFQMDGATLLGNNQTVYAWSVTKHKQYSHVIVDVINKKKFEDVYNAILPLSPQYITTPTAVLNSCDLTENVCFIDIGKDRTFIYFSDDNAICLNSISFWGVEKLDELIMQSFELSKEDATVFRKNNRLFVREDEIDNLTLDQKKIVSLAKGSINDMLGDLKRIILSFRLKNNRPISKIILIGEGADLSDIAGFLNSHLSIKTEPLISDGTFAKCHIMAMAIMGRKRIANFLKGEYALGVNIPFYSIFFIFNRALVLFAVLSLFLLMGYVKNFISYRDLRAKIDRDLRNTEAGLGFDENTRIRFNNNPVRFVSSLIQDMDSRLNQVQSERKIIDDYSHDYMKELVFLAQNIPSDIEISQIEINSGKVKVNLKGNNTKLENLEIQLKNLKGAVVLNGSSLIWEYE